MNLALLIMQSVISLAPSIIQLIQQIETLYANAPKSGAQKLATVVAITKVATAAVTNSPISPEVATTVATSISNVVVAAANTANLFKHSVEVVK